MGSAGFGRGGFLSILHTWGQNLLLHPHIHCVIYTAWFRRAGSFPITSVGFARNIPSFCQ